MDPLESLESLDPMDAALSEDEENEKEVFYLTCEKNWVYYTLIGIAGFFGAYTYLLRGKVFCNAQTGNLILMGLAIGEGRWMDGLYYLVPIAAYLLGTLISELLPDPVKHNIPIRWDTLLIGIEMFAVTLLGCLPESAPVQISQITINFIASMQYNTFRQAEGTPMATTFATNHVRQIGIGLANEIRQLRSEDKSHRVKLKKHFIMLVSFLGGAALGTFFSNLLLGKSIWLTLLPFAVLLYTLVKADLVYEKERLQQKPSGH